MQKRRFSGGCAQRTRLFKQGSCIANREYTVFYHFPLMNGTTAPGRNFGSVGPPFSLQEAARGPERSAAFGDAVWEHKLGHDILPVSYQKRLFPSVPMSLESLESNTVQGARLMGGTAFANLRGVAPSGFVKM